MEVLEEDKHTGEYKVHYIGYNAKHDEWVKEQDTKALTELNVSVQPVVAPFYHHTELLYQFKMALNSEVQLELQFDKYLFVG